MAKFNNTIKYTPTTTYEGGKAYEKNIVEDWCNNLFSAYMEDNYYTTREENIQRFIELTEKVAAVKGYEFVAKASLFARNTLGMRSVSQLVAAWLSQHQFEHKRAYYRNFPHRPDDVAEVIAANESLGNKLNNSMRRGFADYISTLTNRSLGKYKMKTRNYNIYDLVNILHPTSYAIDALKNDSLETPDTWETAISNANLTQEERNKEWVRLVKEHKLGYMALIRNLNNIVAACGNDVEFLRYELCPQIINEEAIRKSMFYPYRFYTAYKNYNIEYKQYIMPCLQRAFSLAVDNMPKLSGKTAVLLDVSGSMESRISDKSNMTIKEVGAVYAAAILLKNPDTTFIKFGDSAKAYNVDINADNIFEVIYEMCANDGCGYGTRIKPAFNLLQESYDRIFIISDMQVMDSNSYWYRDLSAKQTYDNYKATYNPNCQCYSFDLGNYHTQLVPSSDRSLHYMTALNDNIFDFIALLENGESIVDKIDNITYW